MPVSTTDFLTFMFWCFLLALCFTQTSISIIFNFTKWVVIPNHLLSIHQYLHLHLFLELWKHMRENERLWSSGIRPRHSESCTLSQEKSPRGRGGFSGSCSLAPQFTSMETGNHLDSSNSKPLGTKNCDILTVSKIHFTGCSWKI